MKKSSTIFSASILSIGALITRTIGAFYRVPLTMIIGFEGIGYYQMIFPIYAFLIVLSTSGVPLAISKIIATIDGSNSKQKKQSVIKKSFKILSIISFSLFALLIFISVPLSRMQGVKELYLSYILLSPAIIFVAILCIFRGYFQGEMKYFPTAISQIIEQIVKVIFGLLLSLVLMPYGIFYAIAGTAFAVTISEVIASIIIFIQYKKYNKGKLKLLDSLEVDISIKEILTTALPIIASSILLPLSALIDSFLVVNFLSKYFSNTKAVTLFGIESGIVGTIANLPTVISFALATVILPMLSKSKNDTEKKEIISLAKNANFIVIFPCMLGLIIFAKPILLLLFGSSFSNEINNNLNTAINLLRLSSISLFFLSYLQIFSSILQSQNQSKIAIRNLSIGIIIKIIIEIILLNFEFINIYALPISCIIGYFVTFILSKKALSFISLKNKLLTIKIVICSMISISILFIVYMIGMNNISFLTGSFLCIVIYFILTKKYFFDKIDRYK